MLQPILEHTITDRRHLFTLSLPRAMYKEKNYIKSPDIEPNPEDAQVSNEMIRLLSWYQHGTQNTRWQAACLEDVFDLYTHTSYPFLIKIYR
jgi:hypothetical protein